MATPTYTALATTTLSSSTTLLTFGSIPSTYRDLILVYNWTGTTGGDYIYARFNNDTTGSNYPRVQTGQYNGSATNYAGSGDGIYLNSLPGSTGGMGIAQIMDYSATDKHKTILGRNKTSLSVIMSAHRWSNTAAVNEIDIQVSGGGSINAGATFSLYGIEA